MEHIKTPITIDVQTQEPLEPKRGPVRTKNELIKADTWSYDVDDQGNKTFYVYAGMPVTVINSQELYMLIDPSKILEPDYSGWAVISGGGGNVIYDGGSARDIYTKEQIMNAGNALNEII